MLKFDLDAYRLIMQTMAHRRTISVRTFAFFEPPRLSAPSLTLALADQAQRVYLNASTNTISLAADICTFGESTDMSRRGGPIHLSYPVSAD